MQVTWNLLISDFIPDNLKKSCGKFCTSLLKSKKFSDISSFINDFNESNFVNKYFSLILLLLRLLLLLISFLFIIELKLNFFCSKNFFEKIFLLLSFEEKFIIFLLFSIFLLILSLFSIFSSKNVEILFKLYFSS